LKVLKPPIETIFMAKDSRYRHRLRAGKPGHGVFTSMYTQKILLMELAKAALKKGLKNDRSNYR
jgi:hypothetical protein